MHFRRSLAVGAIALACAACGTTYRSSQTAISRPEVTVASADSKLVRTVLVTRMTNIGYRLSRDADNAVVFEKEAEASGGLSFFSGMFGPKPNARVSCVLAEQGGMIRIVADLAIVNNPGTGSEQRTEVTEGKELEQVQLVLNSVAQEVRAMPPPPPARKKKKSSKKKTAELLGVFRAA